MFYPPSSSRFRWSPPLVGFSLSISALACTTGQIGGEIEHSDPNPGEDAAGESCEEVASAPLQLDDETVIGVTAQDLIDSIAGVHETTLAWGDDLSGGSFELTPAPGDSMITIEVIPRPESAAFVDLEVKRSNQDDDRALIDEPGGMACPDEVRVTADVIVTSDNGAFADTFEATFATTTGTVVTSLIDIVPGELEGTFAVTPEGNGEPVQTTILLSFALGSLSGEISGVWQEVFGEPGDDDAAVSGASAVYGRFPADGCESGALLSPESQWADAVLEAVQNANSFELTWESGETTALSVDTTVGKLCLETTSYEAGGVIVGASSATVTSEDGRIDAMWDVEVRAWVEGDQITSISVTSVESEFLEHDAQEFAAASGIAGIETDATDLAFQFVYSPGMGDALSSGTLTIFELTVPDCSRPDYDPEPSESPDGGGAPGCEGIDLSEIETATLVETPLE